MKPIEWSNFPLPLIQVNPPNEARTSEYLARVYKNGIFSNGGELQTEASQKLSRHVDPRWSGYLASSNTAGLIACLLAINVRGKHVLLSNFTFAATLHAVIAAGGIPVIMDIDPETLTISEKDVYRALRDQELQIAAVVPTRIFGLVNDFSNLVDICDRNSISVIIDAAASFPSEAGKWPGRSPALYEVFSLHATKVYGVGEGGLVVGNQGEIEKVKSRANFGFFADGSQKFTDGINAKADEYVAARTLARFDEYKGDVLSRSNFAAMYSEIFAKSPDIRIFETNENTVYAYFPLIFSSEEKLEIFREHISPYLSSRRYYFPSICSGYAGQIALIKYEDLSYSESISRRVLCLPVYAQTQPEVREKIAQLLEAALKELR